MTLPWRRRSGRAAGRCCLDRVGVHQLDLHPRRIGAVKSKVPAQDQGVGIPQDSRVRSSAMRLRPLLLVFFTLVAGACAISSESPDQPATATSSATAASRAATAERRPPGTAPPGIIALGHRQPAPPLRVTAFDGSIVNLDGLRGRPAVVSFFESWCPICQVEQPDLSKVARQFAGRVGFVGVSNHDTVAAGRAYARRFDVSYPLANDASGRTWARWRVPYQPVIVLVDRQGRIAERFDGGTTGGTLRAALTYLARE